MSSSKKSSSWAGSWKPSRRPFRGGVRRKSLIEFASLASTPQHEHMRSSSSSREPHSLQNLMERIIPMYSAARVPRRTIPETGGR